MPSVSSRLHTALADKSPVLSKGWVVVEDSVMLPPGGGEQISLRTKRPMNEPVIHPSSSSSKREMGHFRTA